MTLFVPSKLARVSKFFDSKDEADNWKRNQQFENDSTTREVPSFDSEYKANDWIKKQRDSNVWKVHKVDKVDIQQFYFVTNDRNDTIYKIMAGAIGLGILAGGGLLTFFNPVSYSYLILLSLCYSLGISTLIHSFLGGLHKGEIDLTIPTESNILDFIFKLSGNVKISGPITAFIIVGVLAFVGNKYAIDKQIEQQLEDEQTVQSIIDKLEIEPINGLVFAPNGNVHTNLRLKFKQGQGRGDITRNLMLTEQSRVNSILAENELDLGNYKIRKQIDFNTQIKTNNTSVGFISANSLKKALERLAGGTLTEININQITKEIISECSRLEGVCKVPNIQKIKISFGDGIKLKEALVCPDSPILSESILVGGKPIILAKSLYRTKRIIPIYDFRKVTIPELSPCNEGIDNWIKVSALHRPILFPEGIYSRDGLGEVYKITIIDESSLRQLQSSK